jgi:hypothetical protein
MNSSPYAVDNIVASADRVPNGGFGDPLGTGPVGVFDLETTDGV